MLTLKTQFNKNKMTTMNYKVNCYKKLGQLVYNL